MRQKARQNRWFFVEMRASKFRHAVGNCGKKHATFSSWMRVSFSWKFVSFICKQISFSNGVSKFWHLYWIDALLVRDKVDRAPYRQRRLRFESGISLNCSPLRRSGTFGIERARHAFSSAELPRWAQRVLSDRVSCGVFSIFFSEVFLLVIHYGLPTVKLTKQTKN